MDRNPGGISERQRYPRIDDFGDLSLARQAFDHAVSRYFNDPATLPGINDFLWQDGDGWLYTPHRSLRDRSPAAVWHSEGPERDELMRIVFKGIDTHVD